MKKLLLIAVTAFGLTSVNAQKVGYVNPGELISAMPEAAKADNELKEYQNFLGEKFQDMQDDFAKKDSIFSTDSLKMTPTMKEIKRDELIKLYTEIQGYQSKMQKEYEAKYQEKLAPIREKAFNAIKQVAKEAGYAYILNEEQLIVAPPGDNVLELVKAKLGIKAATPAAAPKPAPAGRK
jgi:outer membrane protein